jgi:hypothetical protein
MSDKHTGDEPEMVEVIRKAFDAFIADWISRATADQLPVLANMLRDGADACEDRAMELRAGDERRDPR